MGDSRRPHEAPLQSRRHDMGSSYRPARSDRHPPPLADRMTFTSGRGSSYRPNPSSHTGSQRQPGLANRHSEFTFESGHPGMQFPPTGPANRNRPPPRASQPHSRRDEHAESGYAKRMARNRNHATGFHARGFRKMAPHQRALLQQRDDGSPEHTMGVSDGPSRFLNPDDLSDDEEADMDVESNSSAHDDTIANGPASNHKVARTASNRADGDSVPKWSNPDPYTALPPPDETTGKKTDFVKLIRKAKNQAAEKTAGHNSVAANDDFISFGDDDMEDKRVSQIFHNTASAERLGLVHMVEDDEPIPRQQHSIARSQHRASLNEVDHSNSTVVVSQGGKRNFDAAKSNDQSLRSKKRKVDSAIGLVADWVPYSNSNLTPWLPSETAYKHIAREPEKWLHNEIIDFYDFVAPRDFEEAARDNLQRRVNSALGTRRFPQEPGRIVCFGSYPAGLYLPAADMDLVYTSDRYHTGGPPVMEFSKKNTHKTFLHKAANRLADARLCQGRPLVISGAKVPIVKFVDQVTRLQVDISFENLSGVHAQECFKKWKEEHPDMTFMVYLLKQFLVMRGLNEVHTGGIGGYSIICLIVSYIQLASKKPTNLGECFLGFLDYYGNKFDLSRQRIVMDPPAVVDKTTFGIDGRPEKIDGLSIQDPNRPDNNISGGSHKARDVFKAFAVAHRTLQDRMRMAASGQYNDASILQCVLGGNYDSYTLQRKRLESLYEKETSSYLLQHNQHLEDVQKHNDEWAQFLGQIRQLRIGERIKV